MATAFAASEARRTLELELAEAMHGAATLKGLIAVMGIIEDLTANVARLEATVEAALVVERAELTAARAELETAVAEREGAIRRVEELEAELRQVDDLSARVGRAADRIDGALDAAEDRPPLEPAPSPTPAPGLNVDVEPVQ
jgi:chemotaxis protein histidine kinase CheA